MFLGIEIGGTKLQLGVGRGDGAPLVEFARRDIEPARGASGILAQIEAAAAPLVARHAVSAVGFGFGGPVDVARGRVLKSHHVDGWAQFPLVQWCGERLGLPARLSNDCDAAALAEARFGAGRGYKVVLYVTVGTGIGGGLVIDGQIYRGNGAGATEIGHLRPGLHATHAEQTVESLASGWGIAAAAQAELAEPDGQPVIALDAALRSKSATARLEHRATTEAAREEFVADLLSRAEGEPERITARLVAQAAAEGNELARDVFARATTALGWAIGQAITLLSPGVVVVGGGVSLADRSLFLDPLIAQVDRYVFPPLVGQTPLVPAQLGEEVVVHGALAIAAGISG